MLTDVAERKLPALRRMFVCDHMGMQAASFQALVDILVTRPTAELESFFLAHGLGAAFAAPGKGWGRQKRINAAFLAAERQGFLEVVMADARQHFGDATEAEKAVKPVTKLSYEAEIPKKGVLPLDIRLQSLHPEILRVAERLFLDGHLDSAILEAFKAVNNEVKDLTGLNEDGKKLMGTAFGNGRDGPRLRLNRGITQSEKDEQEGFTLIFMGAMQGIRNPKAHDEIRDLEHDRALEYLTMASLLMRRLDDVKVGRAADQTVNNP